MNPEHQVGVLIATHNRARTLARALDSALGQDLPAEGYAVVVVDDGSTDETASILRRYHGRIRCLRQTHQGLAAACNRGLAELTAPVYTRLDSDDWVRPEWLRLGLERMEAHPDAVCVYPDWIEVGEDGTQTLRAAPEANLFTLQACGPFLRSDAVRAVGGYRTLFWEEYDLYLRLKACGRFVRLPQPLYVYCRSANGMTAHHRARQAGWNELARVWGAAALREAGYNPELEQCLSASS